MEKPEKPRLESVYEFEEGDLCRVDDADGGELVMYIGPRSGGPGSLIMRATSRGPYSCWIETERLIPLAGVPDEEGMAALEREGPRI